MSLKGTSPQAEAYLLNCAPTTEAIAEAKSNFVANIVMDANGLPVVTVPNVGGEDYDDGDAYGNGHLLQLGAPEVTGPWSSNPTNAKFFKFELVK